MEERNYYIYRHRRLDTFGVFYVGLGSTPNLKRAYDDVRRGSWWKRVVKKAGYKVEILAEGLLKEEVIELEMFLIAEYGRRDLGTGILINLTSGGEGATDISEETRNKRSKALTGKKHTEETLEKLRGGNAHAAKKVIDTKTKHIYSCLKEASSEIGLARTYLSQMMRGMINNTSDLMFLADYEKGKQLKKDVRKRKVQVLDTSTNITYNSIREASKATGVPESSLYYYISGKRTNKTTLIGLNDV